MLCHGAIGLGFLCKGPVILVWVVLPVVGFLATQRRVGSGLRLLIDGPGMVILAGLVLVWPLAVAVRYPESVGVWWLEIGQKTGMLGVEHGNARGSILVEALGTTLPWTPLVLGAWVGPIRRRRSRRMGVEVAATSPALALAWWSAVRPCWRFWVSGTSPSRAITSPPCPPWRSWSARGGSTSPAAPG